MGVLDAVRLANLTRKTVDWTLRVQCPMGQVQVVWCRHIDVRAAEGGPRRGVLGIRCRHEGRSGWAGSGVGSLEVSARGGRGYKMVSGTGNTYVVPLASLGFWRVREYKGVGRACRAASALRAHGRGPLQLFREWEEFGFRKAGGATIKYEIR